MKRQPDERKIRGAYYIKMVLHRERMKFRDAKILTLEKELADIKSAFAFLVSRCK